MTQKFETCKRQAFAVVRVAADVLCPMASDPNGSSQPPPSSSMPPLATPFASSVLHRHRSLVGGWLLIVLALSHLAGCRAIRNFGNSRQAIAARRLSGRGFEAMHDGDWETAETYFSDALDVSRADDRAHWGLAEACWNRHQPEQAIAHMTQAVKMSAGDARMVQRLGRMHFELGNYDAASVHAQTAIEQARDSASAWALQGDCLRQAERHDDALAAYHRALAIQPDYPEVQMQAAEVYHSQQRFDRCLATIDRLQDGTQAEDVPARVDMLQGLAMRQLGRSREARRCFVRAAAKDADDPSPHLELASLDLDMGRVAAARTSLETALRLDPDSVRGGGMMDTLPRTLSMPDDPMAPAATDVSPPAVATGPQDDRRISSWPGRSTEGEPSLIDGTDPSVPPWRRIPQVAEDADRDGRY